ncbi:hypothetical protein LEN26_006527 [Aphanomyces euteiches]|nr:hypothetical protein AeMF1_004637 [Aphanomyces euteiches]KAH9135220.1 hypothetical protein LEN26_006527 [Aphanomyces euteiches]KAH9185398.1 hypothetical protein AeNC1_012626 [Aphanomyces euteiches]
MDSAWWTRFTKTALPPSETSSELRGASPTNYILTRLPRLKAGRLLLEIHGVQRQWESYVVALVGDNIDNLALYYYKHATDKTPAGAIRLCSATVDLMEEIFCVITAEHTWYLCADTQREAEEWVDMICSTLESAATSTTSTPTTLNDDSSLLRRRRLSSHVTASNVKEIQSRDGATRIDEFIDIYIRSEAMDIRTQASRGAFSWSSLRSITWRVWLGCLPPTLSFGEWSAVTQCNRRRYDELCAAYPLDLDALFDESAQNPSACMASSIVKDIRRTRSAMPFFQQLPVQHMLVRLLYIYASEHPNVSYNQGMGELLAILVYLLHVEQWNAFKSIHGSECGQLRGASISNSSGYSVDSTISSLSDFNAMEGDEDDAYVQVDMIHLDSHKHLIIVDTAGFLDMLPFQGQNAKCTLACRDAIGQLLASLTDGAFVEHDAYALFEQVMQRMATIYCPHPSTSPTKLSTSPSCKETALHAQLERIHNHWLRQWDVQLMQHLDTLHIPPEVYLLRWLRLLLAREFQMFQVWALWDAIFALSPDNFRFVEALCVAILLERRADLLAQHDVSGMLQLLKNVGMSSMQLVECGRKVWLAAALDN